MIDKACEIAISYGAYRLKNVRRLLDQKAAKQEQMEFMQEHPIIRSMDVYGELVRKAFRQPPPSWEADDDQHPSVMNPQERTLLMNERLQSALRKLRLSGLAESLEVRLEEAAASR